MQIYIRCCQYIGFQHSILSSIWVVLFTKSVRSVVHLKITIWKQRRQVVMHFGFYSAHSVYFFQRALDCENHKQRYGFCCHFWLLVKMFIVILVYLKLFDYLPCLVFYNECWYLFMPSWQFNFKGHQSKQLLSSPQ